MILRLLVFIVIVALIAAVAVFIADQPGHVEIAWDDYLIELSPAALAGGVAALAALIAGLVLLLRWLWRGPRSFRLARRQSRERLGYEALTQGLVAAAAGDAPGARRLARRANHLLGDPPLTLLLSAQAAQLEGREDVAAHYFTAMLERRETEFLGLRGLIVQATKAGDLPRAHQLAERAYRLRPDTPWLVAALFELRLRAGDRAGSRALIERAHRSGALSPEAAARRAAGLILEEAKGAWAMGQERATLRLAERALAADPRFVAAAILAAEAALALGKRGRAARLIEAVSVHAPHPELGRLYLGLASETRPGERLARAERLAALHPSHPESRRLVADVAIDAKLWGRARAELDPLLAEHPSVTAFRLAARLEEEEKHDAAAARRQLEAATQAPPDPAWLCAACHHRVERWSMVCPLCGALDTIDWRTPEGAPAGPMPARQPAASVLPPEVGPPGPAEPSAMRVPSPAGAAVPPAPVPPPRPDA
jgi:HemY protein